MAIRSLFREKKFINTSSTQLKVFQVLNLLGLNTTLPDVILEPGASPKLENGRIYQRIEDDNQVAISTRKGQGEYITPLGEATDNSFDNSASAGDTDTAVSVAKWTAEKFTTASAGRLTRIDLSFKTSTSGATGPVMLKVYTNNSGEPGTLIASSSVNNSGITASYTELTFNFVDAPQVTTTTDYWIVTHIQNNGSGEYEWESDTSGSTALASVNEGGDWVATTFRAFYNVFLSTDEQILGMSRYYKDGATAETLIASGTNVYKDTGSGLSSIVSGLSAAAVKYRWAEANDIQYFVNDKDVPKQYNGTAVTDLGGTPGVSSICVMHGNRLWLTPTASPNKIIWSNITDYEVFESTSFRYVPAPKTGDPITSVTSFQGNLVIGTRKDKYVVYGSSEDDYTMRKSTGAKGVVSQEAQCVIGNYMYFMSDDGVYIYDGSSDTQIAEPILPTIDAITDKTSVVMVGWKDKLRIYYKDGSTENNKMLLYDTTLRQWVKDTGTFVSYATTSTTGPTSEVKLIEASSLVTGAYFAEVQNSDLGKPIDFNFWTKYFHMGSVMMKKRVKRFYPIMRAQDDGFEFIMKVDKDERGLPTDLTPIDMQAEGPQWGEFVWGEAEWGSRTRVDPRMPIPGSATSFQFRFEQCGVNTPIEVIGFVMYYKPKKPR